MQKRKNSCLQAIITGKYEFLLFQGKSIQTAYDAYTANSTNSFCGLINIDNASISFFNLSLALS